MSDEMWINEIETENYSGKKDYIKLVLESGTQPTKKMIEKIIGQFENENPGSLSGHVTIHIFRENNNDGIAKAIGNSPKITEETNNKLNNLPTIISHLGLAKKAIKRVFFRNKFSKS